MKAPAKKVTDFIHRLDPSRLVDSASGWFDQGCGDINSLHYYFLGLPVPESDRVLALSEFGGYSLRLQEHSACKNIYGYKKFTTSEALTDGFSRLMENTIVQPKNPLEMQEIVRNLLNMEDNSDLIYSFKARKLTVEAEEEVAWTLDGEYGGSPRVVEIENLQQALNLCLKSDK